MESVFCIIKGGCLGLEVALYIHVCRFVLVKCWPHPVCLCEVVE